MTTARKVFVTLGQENGQLTAVFKDDSMRSEDVPRDQWPKDFTVQKPKYVLGLDERDEPNWEDLVEVHVACGVEQPNKKLVDAA